jgi:hypothetical protein
MCTPGMPMNSRPASRKHHVQNTKGNVNELMRHGESMLFMPVRTHVVSAAHITSAIHIHMVGSRKVGSAQPTSMPLKPHRPSRPSAVGNRKNIPASVLVTRPASAPHATTGMPSMYEPANMPMINSSPVHGLSWNITCAAPRLSAHGAVRTKRGME